MKFSAIISTKKIADTPERIAHQNACIQSWHDHAHRVILLNKPKDVADLKYVEAVEPLEEHPSLAQVIKTAAIGRGMYDHDPIAIIPCDVMMQGSLAKLDNYIRLRQVRRAWAATSHRWEGDNEIEWAFDLFAATKKIWKEFRDIPAYLKIGQPMWDIWINEKLNIHVGDHRYVNLSPLKVVNHEPHEGGRNMDKGINAGKVTGWMPPVPTV